MSCYHNIIDTTSPKMASTAASASGPASPVAGPSGMVRKPHSTQVQGKGKRNVEGWIMRVVNHLFSNYLFVILALFIQDCT